MAYKPNFSDLDAAAFEKHISEHEYCKEKNKKLEMFQMVGEMLSDINPDCKLAMSGNILDLFSVEYNIEGSGYGDLVHLIFKALTMGMQEEIVERIKSDFNECCQNAEEKAEEKAA